MHRQPERTLTVNKAMHGQAVWTPAAQEMHQQSWGADSLHAPCGKVFCRQAVLGHIAAWAASELCSCVCRALTNGASLDKELPDELLCHLQGTQHA